MSDSRYFRFQKLRFADTRIRSGCTALVALIVDATVHIVCILFELVNLLSTEPRQMSVIQEL